ncbi:hypothetical protein [Streptomyces klenkii]|uniref:hypothetical protein n=1 Tax=Streptomyces klenkii TaxID=1420899 RepID=UPI00342DBDCA
MLALVLFSGFVVGMAAALVLVIRGARSASRRGRKLSRKPKDLALILGGAAIGVYAWGMAHTGLAVMQAEDGGAGSFPLKPCRDTDATKAVRVIGYEVDFVPLRFECRLDDGTRYRASSVPDYINPAALGLSLIAVTLAAAVVISRDDKSMRKGTHT